MILKKARFMSIFVIMLVASCVTVNIYFPAAAVQKAADEIVEEVRGKDKAKDTKEQMEKQTPPDQAPQKDDRKGTMLRDTYRATFWGVGIADAQIDVEVTTPAIRGLKDEMRRRFAQLKPFYDRGNIGENNAGFIEIRDAGALPLKDKSDLNRLLDAENRDRRALYTEIMKANKYGPDVLPQIQKIFANSWRDKSQPGWWIQSDRGQWERKR